MAEPKKKRNYPKPTPKRTFGDGEVRVHVRLRTDTIGLHDRWPELRALSHRCTCGGLLHTSPRNVPNPREVCG